MHRRSTILILLCALSLPACGPGKDTSETEGPASTGSSSTAEPTTAAPATTSTDGSTGAPASTSTDGPTSSTGSSSTGDASSGGPPPGSCEARMTEEDCLATQNGGHEDCQWQPEFAQWSEQDGCGALVGPPRCLTVHYVGDGCFVNDCPAHSRVYFRDLGGGAAEIMDYQGTCGLEPAGWTMCTEFVTDPPCACFC